MSTQNDPDASLRCGRLPPAETCLVLTLASETAALGVQFARQMRSLRQAVAACTTCPQKQDCKLDPDKLNSQIDSALTDLYTEWGFQ